jgi:hypothetical protein
MPHDELRKGERLDSVIPSAHANLARQLIRLAERVRKSPGPRVIGQTCRGALLPFERPRCLAGRYPLNVTVTAYSSRRGDYWYFKCPKCGRRYWSGDGRARPVSPKGGNWNASKGTLVVTSAEWSAAASLAATGSAQNVESDSVLQKDAPRRPYGATAPSGICHFCERGSVQIAEAHICGSRRFRVLPRSATFIFAALPAGEVLDSTRVSVAWWYWDSEKDETHIVGINTARQICKRVARAGPEPVVP